MAKKSKERYGRCQNHECMNYGMSEVIPEDGNCSICHKPMKPEEDSDDGGDIDLDNIDDVSFEESNTTEGPKLPPKGPNYKLIAGIIAAMLVLGGVVFGIWKAFGGSDPLDEITKIKLDKKSISLFVGQNDVIKATVLGKDGKEIKDVKLTFKWEIKDKEVASVTQGGEVTALRKGKTSVTVKIEGNDKHSDTCQINVKLKKIPGENGKSDTTKVTDIEEPEPKPGPEPGPEPHKLNLSYGTYYGSIVNGYPDGQGRLEYKTSRQISRFDPKGRIAQAGESVQGTFKNGFLTIGKHFDANGNLKETLNIGAPTEGIYESK